MGEVGTTKLFEDDRIVMWEFVLEPGERTLCHTHRHDYLFYVLEGSPRQKDVRLPDSEYALRQGLEAR